MRPTEDDWLKAIEESVHQRTAVPVLSGPAAEFCLEHPELIEAIKTLLANAQAERLKEAWQAKRINSEIKEWLARGIWPLVEAELTANGRRTTKEEIRREIAIRLKKSGYKVGERIVRAYTKGLHRTQ
jgi:hypothetical protein